MKVQTLMLEAADICTGGFVQYRESRGGLSVDFGVNFKCACRDIYKLCALSSRKPFNKPVVADTLEFCGETAQGSRHISAESLASSGYSCEDIDTFVIVKKQSDGSWGETVSRCFKNLVWDTEGAFKIPSDDYIVKNPVERARQALKSVKKLTAGSACGADKIWIEKVRQAASCLRESSEPLPEGYRWYISEDIRPAVPLSAYRHLLFVTEFMHNFDRNGYWLFGIGPQGHTALAAKADGCNPFINAADCAVKIGGYWTVGVYLGEDGQYFERVKNHN